MVKVYICIIIMYNVYRFLSEMTVLSSLVREGVYSLIFSVNWPMSLMLRFVKLL